MFYELTVSKEISPQGRFLTNTENVPQILSFDKGSLKTGKDIGTFEERVVLAAKMIRPWRT